MTSKNRVKSNTAIPNLGLLNNVVILHYDYSKILTINFSINLKMCQVILGGYIVYRSNLKAYRSTLKAYRSTLKAYRSTLKEYTKTKKAYRSTLKEYTRTKKEYSSTLKEYTTILIV
jgi:hypothetical protein